MISSVDSGALHFIPSVLFCSWGSEVNEYKKEENPFFFLLRQRINELISSYTLRTTKVEVQVEAERLGQYFRIRYASHFWLCANGFECVSCCRNVGIISSLIFSSPKRSGYLINQLHILHCCWCC